MCGITLKVIPRRRYDGVPEVGCSPAVVSKTVARVHEAKHFGRFLQVCYDSGNTRMGEARQGVNARK